MSTRTVIEINHDHLSAMLGNHDPSWRLANDKYPIPLLDFLWQLRQGTPARAPSGVRVLGQRHHSETLNLKVE